MLDWAMCKKRVKVTPNICILDVLGYSCSISKCMVVPSRGWWRWSIWSKPFSRHGRSVGVIISGLSTSRRTSLREQHGTTWTLQVSPKKMPIVWQWSYCHLCCAPGPTHCLCIAEALMEQAMIGPSPNPLILSYLKYAISSQVRWTEIPLCSVVKQ